MCVCGLCLRCYFLLCGLKINSQFDNNNNSNRDSIEKYKYISKWFSIFLIYGKIYANMSNAYNNNNYMLH